MSSSIKAIAASPPYCLLNRQGYEAANLSLEDLYAVTTSNRILLNKVLASKRVTASLNIRFNFHLGFSFPKLY